MKLENTNNVLQDMRNVGQVGPRDRQNLMGTFYSITWTCHYNYNHVEMYQMFQLKLLVCLRHCQFWFNPSNFKLIIDKYRQAVIKNQHYLNVKRRMCTFKSLSCAILIPLFNTASESLKFPCIPSAWISKERLLKLLLHPVLKYALNTCTCNSIILN